MTASWISSSARGGGDYIGKVRVYLNTGTQNAPEFDDYFYAQSLGSDLTSPASGCMGLFPRVVYWDADGRKDLLVGRADGMVRIYMNIGTDEDPHFDGGTFLQVGEPGSKIDIDIGSRATSTAVDWNSDGKKDLVTGAIDGRIHLFINEGSDALPDFRSEQYAQNLGSALFVPSVRSSPHVADWDADGKKDLLTGNTNGELLFYSNTGTDEDPSFSGYVQVEADGVVIDLPGTPRSRPSVCDWNTDHYNDVLIGAGDGLVHLYQGREGGTFVDGEGLLPDAGVGHLLAAYPNPFNPQTTIAFALQRAERIRLSVYDLSGRRVALLEDRVFPEGRHEIAWRGEDGSGRWLPSGVYFAQLEIGDISEARRLILLR